MKEQNCPPPGVLATSHEVLHDEHAMPFDELKELEMFACSEHETQQQASLSRVERSVIFDF